MSESIPPTTPAAPSAENAWLSFARRVAEVLIRPTAFWNEREAADLSYRELMFPHALVLIGLRALAGMIGQLLGGAEFLDATKMLVLHFTSWFALLWIFAVLAFTIASARGARLSVHDAVGYSTFGLTPLFVVGLLAAVPLPYVAPVAELVTMPWAFYVLSVGVAPALQMPRERAAGMAGLMCGAVLVLWSVVPNLLPRLFVAMTAN